MPIRRLGYACQNLSLPASTNHTFRLASLPDTDKVKTTVQKNFSDLERILEFNDQRGIRLFRLGQQLIPFASHPAFSYDWQTEHAEELDRLGRKASEFGIRLSFHPGQYIQPGSPRVEIRKRSVAELRYNARVLELMGAHDGVIVLHGGGLHGDRTSASHRLIEALRPEQSVLKYLALENDETCWSVEEILQLAGMLKVPVIADTLHHALRPGNLSLKAAIERIIPTWNARYPKLHISSQARGERTGKHAKRVLREDWDKLVDSLPPHSYADVMIEAKDKEKAIASWMLEMARTERRD